MGIRTKFVWEEKDSKADAKEIVVEYQAKTKKLLLKMKKCNKANGFLSDFPYHHCLQIYTDLNKHDQEHLFVPLP